MSDYKGIKGFQVQTRTEDPTPYAQALADNPYAGAWASGTSVNLAVRSMASFGSFTAALKAGGIGPPGSERTASEKWNGSSWTEDAFLNSGRQYFVGSGTTTAGLVFGGVKNSPSSALGNTETYNGSAFSEANDLNTAREQLSRAAQGTSTASLAFGGATGPSTNSDTNESWNGTSWTELAEINTARKNSGGAGTSTAALNISGTTGPSSSIVTNNESWNGSAWTEVSEVNTARGSVGSSGTSTSALMYGGFNPGNTAVTESWDGSAWTEVADLATARQGVGGAGVNGLTALAISGYTTTNVTNTEEWTFSGIPPATPAADYADAITGDFYYNSTTGQFKTVNTGGAPIGTWASGTSINTARQSGGNAGTVTSALFISGTPTPAAVEIWDGSSWTETAELNTARITGGSTGMTGTAAIYAGGEASGPTTNVETWDGSSFTEQSDVPVGVRASNMFGSSTAAVLTCGATGTPGATSSTAVEWNGSSWTSITEMGTDRNVGMEAGLYNLGIIATGGYDPGNTLNNVEQWNGSSWTEVSEVNTARAYGISGIASAYDNYIICSGAPIDASPLTANTEFWNGSSWTEVADLASAARSSGGAGTSGSSALIFGGLNPSVTTDVFEWAADDFQIKSVTTS